MTQAFVDLNRLADLLRDNGVLGALERRIRRFHGKVVIKTDLDAARRSIDQLNTLMLSHPDPKTMSAFELAAGEALCVHAVVVYCRALVSEGAGRFGTDAQYTPDLAAAHERISSLRNRRFCHYGLSEDDREASWSDDRAILALDEGTLRLRFATSRRGWDLRVVDDLNALTDHALVTVERQARAETDGLFDEIVAAVDDPSFWPLAQASKFEPREFFASLEQADALGSSEVGVFNGVRFGVFVDD